MNEASSCVLTVKTKLSAVPTHEPADGVTVMLATSCTPVVVPVKAAMSFVPVAAKPMLVLSLTQSNTLPALPVKSISAKSVPSQMV